MEHEPTKYSRPLVVGGLGLVLLADIAGDPPNQLFIGGGVAVLLTAALVHFAGDEARAAAGWVFFGLALGFFGLVDVGSSTVSLLGVFSLLAAGLALQVSQRLEKRVDDEGSADG